MRHVVPEAEAILDRPTPVLDHGFVTLVDYMGSDKRIVDAARLSIAGEGVRPVTEDKALIRYLMANRHSTPMEFVNFTFHVKLPIFVARQWIRHRTGAFNEMSARYSELPEEFYVPDADQMAFQDKKNKQGRADVVSNHLAEAIRNKMKHSSEFAFYDYHGYLGRLKADEPLGQELAAGGGLARELARINLPLSTYTAWYWKIDLHNLFHFLKLRLDAHAQYEIRVYAEAMVPMVKAVVPLAWEAFEDFRLNGMGLSKLEVEALRANISELRGVLHTTPQDFPTKREHEAFITKLKRLGVT